MIPSTFHDHCYLPLLHLGTHVGSLAQPWIDLNLIVSYRPWYISFFCLPWLVPGASPQALTAYNTSKSSIYARWQEIVEDKQHGIMLGYKLFVYELTGNGSKTVENRTYGLDKVETNFTRLKVFTKYRIEVLGFNDYGDGPIVAVELSTEESGK